MQTAQNIEEQGVGNPENQEILDYPLELNQDISLGMFQTSSQNLDLEYKALNLEFENSGLN